MKISNFAKRLKEAMDIRKVSQTELHEKTGIGKPSINAYLKGEYKAKQDKVDLIAEALSVDPTWLIGYDVPMEHSSRESFNNGYYTNPEVAEFAEELRTNPNGRILFDASKDLSKEDINVVLTVIEGLKRPKGGKDGSND